MSKTVTEKVARKHFKTFGRIKYTKSIDTFEKIQLKKIHSMSSTPRFFKDYLVSCLTWSSPIGCVVMSSISEMALVSISVGLNGA